MITINPDIYGKYTLKTLRDKAYYFLKKEFSGKIVKNRNTGFNIEFNSSSFRKLTSGNIAENKLLALGSLEEIILNGTLYSAKVDSKQRKNIKMFLYFFIEVKIKGRLYLFRFSVKFMANERKFIYSGFIK